MTIMPEYSLKQATPDDLKVVMAWVHDPEQLRLWGGPKLSWPLKSVALWREMEAEAFPPYALMEDGNYLAGFGQILLREPGTAHLGRIILSPERRGRGLGRVLVEKLIAKGTELYHPQRFTLNVYRRNLPAVATYQSIGFEVLEEDAEHASWKMEWTME